MMRTPDEKNEYRPPLGRLFYSAIVLIGLLSLLVLRLWYLQVVKWEYYANQSDKNRLRPQVLKAPRGNIYGRGEDGSEVLLADNRAARDLVLVPAECGDDVEAICRQLAEVMALSPEQLQHLLDKLHDPASDPDNIDAGPYRQIVVKRNMSYAELARFQELAFSLPPGIFTVAHPQRRYLFGATGGQLMGYINEVNPDDLESTPGQYTPGDLIGRAGVERVYDALLRGWDGEVVVTDFAEGLPQLRTDASGRPYVVQDSYGHHLDVNKRIEPVQGESLHLSLDIGLQKKAEELLEDCIGAIVVLNADTGEVYALASRPTYDPNVFVQNNGIEERKRLLTEKPSPMRNRCYQEQYPVGSVFKILIAMAALEEGVINENTTQYCPGFVPISAKQRKRCWKRSGHGNISTVDAIAYSCDVFFYKVGVELGVERIGEWAVKFGYGQKTGIDLSNEVSGLIPSPEWKEEAFKSLNSWDRKWFPAETMDLAIGQGYMTATALQNATLMAAVLNGGKLVHPHLSGSPKLSEPLVSQRTIDIVRKGMRKCVEKDTFPRGTGTKAQVPGLVVLGKTGTAQTVPTALQEPYEEEDLPYELRDHGWFISGVLDREPKLAVCLFGEHVHHGSVMAPKAKALFEYYYLERGQNRTLASVTDGNGNEYQ